MGEGGLTVEVQELDENGRPHGTGRFETLDADTVILALGQESDTPGTTGGALPLGPNATRRRHTGTIRPGTSVSKYREKDLALAHLRQASNRGGIGGE